MMIHNRTYELSLFGELIEILLFDFLQFLAGIDVFYGLWLEVLWGYFEEPLSLDFEDGSDVVLLGQHQLVIQHQLRLVGKHRAGMNRHNLAFLDSEVGVVLLKDGNLGEIACQNALLDVIVVRRDARLVIKFEIELDENGLQLFSNVIC